MPSRRPPIPETLRAIRKRMEQELVQRSQGPLGVLLRGHRSYVGGRWREIGELQFRFLVERGLRPDHVLLDIGCGALRGGVLFIEYLEPGHYLGIDREAMLVRRGVIRELGRERFRKKRPELVVSRRFEFGRFSKRPTHALAQSLFTHLTEVDIGLCLKNLRAVAEPGFELFATFFEVDEPVRNPARSSSTRRFYYTRSELERLGKEHGFCPKYVGNWGHDKSRMMRFTVPRPARPRNGARR